MKCTCKMLCSITVGNILGLIKRIKLQVDRFFHNFWLEFSTSYMIQALPEISITGQRLANKMKYHIKKLAVTNFIVCTIVKDNYSVNVKAFSKILNKYGISYFSILHTNNHLKCTCLFFNTVHLVKNRINFLNSKKLMLPAFEFPAFEYPMFKGVYNIRRNISDTQLWHKLEKLSEESFKVIIPRSIRPKKQ